uniref:Uncharacterized protein n=1 Tax=Meloidogyne floridensis TaxID=298350 RepID=A0A915NYF3_9BILA
MRKRSNRLPVLLIVLAAFIFICIACLFIWLKNNNNSENKFLKEKQEGNLNKIYPTTTSQIKETTKTTTEEEESSELTDSSTFSTTITEDLQQQTTIPLIDTTSPFMEEIIEKPQLKHIPICPEPPLEEINEINECEGGESNPLQNDYLNQNDIFLQPFEYFLNISLPNNNNENLVNFQLNLLAELQQKSNILFLNYGKEMGIINENEVRIWNCQKSRFVCINSIIRQLDNQKLIFNLKEYLESKTILRFYFFNLKIPLSSPKLLVQIPSPWERERAWMLGNKLFSDKNNISSYLFPSIEDSENIRIVFHLCLFHPQDVFVRSNTIVESIGSATKGILKQQKTCFKETPPIPQSKFTFLLFRNLQSVPPPQENVKNGKFNKTFIELFIGAHLKPTDYTWAIEESQRTMKRMTELTNTEYPLPRLTIVSSPLGAGNDAMGGLGLVQIRDSWMEYPKFVYTHNLLVGQIVQQWTTNLLSICNQCTQKGISLFLEWILASELSENENEEFGRRVDETRRRLFGGGGEAGIVGSTNPTINQQQCIERSAFSLHTLDSTFGREIITKFLNLLFSKYSWVFKCTTNSELSKLFFEASGGNKQMQNIFDSLFNSKIYLTPLIRIKVLPLSSILNIELNNNLTTKNIQIPIEVIDDTGKINKLILNSSQIITKLPIIVSAFLVAKPSSFARFLYNVENYIHLIECLEPTKCPSIKQISVKDAFEDLCWALLQQKLNPLEEEIPKWKELFKTLNSKGAVHNDCACCMQTETEALKSHCRWTWLDKCKKIKMLN